ncbi:MAG TPA: hypothetical protein VGF45_02285 [Polyangia bacterium]
MIRQLLKRPVLLLTLSLSSLSSCDALKNPERAVASARFDRDGKGILFLDDGVAKVDAALNLKSEVAYPLNAMGWTLGEISADGKHAAYAWRGVLQELNSTTNTIPLERRPGLAVFNLESRGLERHLEVSTTTLALSDDGALLAFTPTIDAVVPEAQSTEMRVIRIADGGSAWVTAGNFVRIRTVPGAGAIAAITRATQGGPPPELRVVDFATGQLRFSVPIEGDPETVAASSDGSVVAVATEVRVDKSPVVRYIVVDAADGSVRSKMEAPGHRRPFPDLVVSSNGRLLAAPVYVITSGSEPINDGPGYEILFWEDGALRHVGFAAFWVHEDSSIALSADSKSLLVPEFGGLRLFSVPDGRLLRSPRYTHDIF